MPFPLFSLLAAAGNTIANSIATRRANRINQQQYEEVRRYNTPAAQMARFRAAGLNPHLIYTQTNEADPRPEWKPPQLDFSAISNSPSELSTYQNIKESKSRVDNLVKQNSLLDAQITQQVLLNTFQDLVNKNYQDLTDYQKHDYEVKWLQIQKSLDLINEQIREISNNISLNNRRFSLDNARFIFDKLQQDRQFNLALKQFGLDSSKFNEFVRQFNTSHQLQSYVMEFMKGFTGYDNPEQAAKIFGTLVKQWINGELGNSSRFDHSESQIESAKKKGIPYRQGGAWRRPWDDNY